MARGRKPKPTQLKAITGNPGNRPLNTTEPKLPASPYDPPDWLEGEARKKWNAEIKQYVDCGLLTTGDRDIFAMYCFEYTEWIRLKKKVSKVSETVTTANGAVQVNPLIYLAGKMRDRCIRMEAEIGITPSSRSRVKAVSPPGEASGWDRFKRSGQI